MKLSEQLDIAAKIHEDMSGKTALSTTIRQGAEVVRRVERQMVETGGCAPPVVVGRPQVNELFGNPEQLASMEGRARDMLATAYEKSANYRSAVSLRDHSNEAFHAPALAAITAALANQQGVGGAWLGTDIDSLRSIVLDETGCMVDLALYIASPNDGGPTIRQGRYDAACGFVDSTTGRRIDVDAWSAPSRALTQPAGDVGRGEP